MPTSTRLQKVWALLQQRCPRCCRGKIYLAGFRMHTRCPVCDLLFDREPGYFLGALYFSYVISTILLLLGLWVGSAWFPDFDLGWMVLILGVLYLPLVPLVTRYARVLWIWFDRWAWPAAPGKSD